MGSDAAKRLGSVRLARGLVLALLASAGAACAVRPEAPSAAVVVVAPAAPLDAAAPPTLVSLRLDQADAERPTPCTAAARASGGEEDPDLRRAVEAEIVSSIATVSPTERTVTQCGVALMRAHDGVVLSRQARMVPEFVNGVPVGVQLFGVRADSIASRLGFENGDRIDRIGVQATDTPEHLVAALQAVGSGRNEVTIWRRGQPQKLVVILK